MQQKKSTHHGVSVVGVLVAVRLGGTKRSISILVPMAFRDAALVAGTHSYRERKNDL
jgi:hypothetical protein